MPTYKSSLCQRLRFFSSFKIILFIFILLVILFKTLFFNKKNQWCDPTKPLWWFCPWPGPETVCTWDQHFPLISNNIRDPQSSFEMLLKLPKLRSSFEYNNKTLTKCSEDSIDLLIFIISKCSHSSIRQSIRRTWANINSFRKEFPSIKLKLLFLVDIDSISNEKIILESKYHQDIVQIVDLPEQYEYVTQREAALYQFVHLYCKQTKFIFKTDDDIFINTYLLLSFIKEYLLNKDSEREKYLLYGYPIEHGLVVRHSNDKVGQRYIITSDEYSCPRYPTFLSGFGYLFSYDLSSLFYNAYLTDMKPFPLSDVYFTGLLAQLFNIQKINIYHNVDYLYDNKCNEDYFRFVNNPFACAASNDHFDGKQSNDDRSLMNDYNFIFKYFN